MEMKKAGSSEVAVVAEEAKKMQAMTISFGVPDPGMSKSGVGYVPLSFYSLPTHRVCRFKYDAQVVQCALFPHLYQDSVINPPPAKRRKTAGQADGHVEADAAEDPRQGIMLEGSKETYLVTWPEGRTRYTLSVLGPPDETSARKAPPPVSSTLLIPPAEAVSKTRDAPKDACRGSSEERRMAADEPRSLGGPTGASQDPGAKRNETEAVSIPPSIPRRPASPPPTARVLRSNLSDDDFSFDKGMILIKGAQHTDDKPMHVDGEQAETITMRVLRWRWYWRP